MLLLVVFNSFPLINVDRTRQLLTFILFTSSYQHKFFTLFLFLIFNFSLSLSSHLSSILFLSLPSSFSNFLSFSFSFYNFGFFQLCICFFLQTLCSDMEVAEIITGVPTEKVHRIEFAGCCFLDKGVQKVTEKKLLRLLNP